MKTEEVDVLTCFVATALAELSLEMELVTARLAGRTLDNDEAVAQSIARLEKALAGPAKIANGTRAEELIRGYLKAWSEHALQ